MAHMQPGLVVFAQPAVAQRLQVLGQPVVPGADLHILGVAHDGDAPLVADGERLGHHAGVLDAVAVLGDEADRFRQGLEVVQGDAVEIFGDGHGLVGAAQAGALGLLLHHGRLRRRGADRLCVGHQVDEGVAARRRRAAAGLDVLLIFKAGGPPMGMQVHKGRQDGQAARIQDGFIGAGQGCKPPPHRLDRSPAEVELDGLSAGVDCVLDEHGVSSFGQPHTRRRAGRGQKKTFPEKGKSSAFTNGEQTGCEKTGCKAHLPFFQPVGAQHGTVPLPHLSCRYFIIEAQKVSMG